MKPGLQRRALLQAAAAGGALMLGFRIDDAQAQAAGAGHAVFQPNRWLRVERDGRVLVLLTKTEMGQGIETGLAMVVADELDADWARVGTHIVAPESSRFMMTGGSYSMAVAWDPLRQAAAAARQMLLEAGARELAVPIGECRTAQGQVRHAASGRALDYGRLVEAASRLRVPQAPVLKSPREFTLIGRPLGAINAPAIVRAEAVYGIDVHVPGMLYAVIERAPVLNGRLARVDDRAARAVPGVLDVRVLRGNVFPQSPHLRDGVAVIAGSTWAALQGRRALKLQWQLGGSDNKAGNGALASSAALAQDFERALAGTATRTDPDTLHTGVSALSRGSAEGLQAAFAGAARTLDLRYDVPLQAHAPMEPVNAVAHWQGDRVEIWAGTHFQSRVLRRVRDLTGLSADRVLVHTPLLGGSFGRRLEVDFVLEAVQLSRELARPVQLLWTREDDLQHGLFGPPSRHQVRAALGADGRLLALEHAFATLSVRRQNEPENIRADGLDHTTVFDALKFPYAVAQMHVRQHLVEQAIRVFWWRRGYTPNHTFVNECLLDECAHAAGADPLAYRLNLLGAPRVIDYDNEGDAERIDTGRLAHVLRAACEAAGWGRPLPAGTGRGLAATVTDTHVAQVVEVDSRSGRPHVRRVVCAVDCGRVVNPQLVRAQVEGSVVFALTAALKGAITIEGGRVQQSNFHDYPLLRIDEMPALEVVLVESEAAPTGIGEQASHPTAAALANAWFAATGERLRALPLRPGATAAAAGSLRGGNRGPTSAAQAPTPPSAPGSRG
jgi:isoquinoline 1-oxidoreductase beta subunit